MIELHLAEDKIFYAVVEEFLFNKLFNQHKSDIFCTANIKVMVRDNTLAPCVKWYKDHCKEENKAVMIKYQETDHGSYVKVLKVYNNEGLNKYLMLV